MRRKTTLLAQRQQPIHWVRTFLIGAISAAIMMAFIDTFYLLGYTHFSFELYLGALIQGQASRYHAWIYGLLANGLVGGLFGLFYSYLFESIFKRSTAHLGALLGVGHATFSGLMAFPFFDAIHEQMGTHYPSLGILGIGSHDLGLATFPLLVAGHILYGATFGLFYGPVGIQRARAKFFEPGESGMPDDPDVLTANDDPEDRVAL